jgi:AraC-like DNA-binding protein
VGFRDVAYFSRQFQRFTGMTPGRWRHLERENALAQSRCPACGETRAIVRDRPA